MTRRPFLLLVLGALLPLAVACGSDGTASPTTASPTTASPGTNAASGVQRVTPAEGAALIAAKGKDLTIVDVRTPQEFAAGHLQDAVNLDLEGGQFSKEITSLPKDAAYIVYCHSGRRSAIATATMAAAGFTTVYDLGGIADWQAAGQPIVTG
jgi:rhodanese-related sulfurtransferase